MKITRRHTLQGIGAATLVAATGGPQIALASAPIDRRLVVVFLRGAMDGLSVFPAYADPDHERARAGIAMAAPGEEGGALRLDDTFGVHPLLTELKSLYDAGDMAVVHAIASPYRERSHFDGQNLVENGSDEPYGLNTGFLNRALVGLPSRGPDIGVSLTPSMPVAMRGEAPVTSWSPSRLPQPDEGMLARVMRLYGEDPSLADTFQKSIDANAAMAMGGGGPSGEGFEALMRASATFLKSETGPRVAFLELGGWDTHAGQMGYRAALYRNLETVNASVAAFREEIGDAWADTAVVFVTEFGRTVAMNGTNGTDHGTGGAAFLIGGAVDGGKVITDWPGLKPSDLHEGRDLRPTADLRSLFKGLLRDQLGVEEAHLERVVFPDSAGARAMGGLIRT